MGKCDATVQTSLATRFQVGSAVLMSHVPVPVIPDSSNPYLVFPNPGFPDPVFFSLDLSAPVHYVPYPSFPQLGVPNTGVPDSVLPAR